MAIVKRGRRYQAKIRGSDGRWWSATVDSLKDAQKLEREMRRARDTGETWVHPRDRVGKLTLRELCEAYIRAHAPPKLAKSTWIRRGQELEKWVTWAEQQTRGRLTADRLSRRLLEQWFQAKIASGISVASAQAYLKHPRAAWAWAWEYAPELGWEGQVEPPRAPALPRARNRVVQAPTWAEADAMIAAIQIPWARRAATLQRFLGSRISETKALTWADIDLQRRELTFRPETTKGGYGGRVVPIAPGLVALLERWERPAQRVCSFRPGARLKGHNKFYRAAWAEADINPRLWEGRSSHAFRRMVFTELRAAGADHDAVKAYLGQDLGDHAETYMDLRALGLREVVELIPPFDVEVA